MSAAVAADQRYTRSRPCPICSGSQSDPRGESRRCIGYLSPDGTFARCSREEHAGGLQLEDATETYVHNLTGPCRCGERHDGEIDRAAGTRSTTARSKIVAAYRYEDEKGALLFEVVRCVPKTFRQRRPDGKGGWIWNLGNVRRVLYRLPELLAADPAVTVWIVEGEKDVDNLTKLGLVATTNAGGCGGVSQWQRRDFCEPLRGRHVVVIPDADDDGKGQRHAAKVAKALHGIAASVRVVELPGAGKDVSDWFAAGGTLEELVAMAAKPASGTKTTVTLTCMADVDPLEVAWLWPARIPAGMLVVLDGAPGAGKSSVVCDLAARITTGRPWPAGAGRREPRDVILLAHEDSAAHTVRPRLDVAGADARRVHVLDAVHGRIPRLPDDIAAVESAIATTRAALLVIDPISAYIGEADLHRDNEVRSALTPLVQVAERTGAAIVLVRHLRKSGGTDAIYRGLGSVAITALARTSMMLLPDPDDEGARVLTWPLLRVGPAPQSLRWRFGASDPGRPAPIVWDDTPSELTADEMLERADNRARPGSLGSEAEDFLREALQNGPVGASDLMAQANAAGIHEKTLKRARERLGVTARKQGRAWFVSWPGGRGTTGSLTRIDGPLVPLPKEEGQEGPDLAAGPLVPLASEDVI